MAFEIAERIGKVIFRDRRQLLDEAKLGEATAIKKLQEKNRLNGKAPLLGIENLSTPKIKKAARGRVVESGKTKNKWGW